jgi:predicted DNA-binding transcriptional regulator AlpA
MTTDTAQISMTFKEFVQIVGESETVIRSWIARGRLTPGARFGRMFNFTESDVARAHAIRGQTRSLKADRLLSNNEKGLITIEQAAAMIGITSRQVRRLMSVQPGHNEPLLQGYRVQPHAAAMLNLTEVTQYIARRSKRSA